MAECQNVEYKESWRDEYLKWVCDFANTQGGTIYIGLRDSGKIILKSASNRVLILLVIMESIITAVEALSSS